MATDGTRWPSEWYAPGIWNLPDPNYPCQKKKFPNKHSAKTAIKRVRSQMKLWERREGKADAFKCRNCGLWHWGHKKRRDDERIRQEPREDRYRLTTTLASLSCEDAQEGT